MEDQALIARIAERQQRLKTAASQLKAHFVGLDEVIDKIISNIEAWYCMPELLTRPTIVCLWGLTGIGKTDLVRRLVHSLDYTDNFVEIQLTNKGSSQHTYATTLQSILTGSNVAAEDPGILLLDEIQRFRSVDEDGNDIHDYMFQDLWMLLSDGSFGSASDNKQQILEIILEAIYWEDYNRAQKECKKKDDEEEDDEEEDKEVEQRRKFKQTYWHARQLKRKLRLTDSVEEIMKWDSAKKLEILTEKMNDKSVFRAEVFAKLLIFVSGNLDEAYAMADQTDESDVEADLFHKHSLRVNVLSVKQALRSRFKPEQIARFGNTHVVYPALNRATYEEIIHRKVSEVLTNVTGVSGIRFACHRSVFDAIYRNGVFPVQGTRPVFSTISSFFESMLPTFALRCLQQGQKEAELFYEKKHLCAKIGDGVVRVKNEGDIDRIKKEKRNANLIRKVAVHESGHAVVYAALFGYVPTQVAVLVASEDKNGFVGLHSIDTSYDFLLSTIRVYLAGRVAEEVVFGKANVSGGASGDIEKATATAAHIVRLYGMGERVSRHDLPVGSGALNFNVDLKPSNEEIESILRREQEQVESLLRLKQDLLLSMSDYLIKHEKISDNKFIALCAEHDIRCEVLDAKERIFPRYEVAYNSFREQETENR